MRTFDVKQVEKFSGLFPELTTIEQLETAILLAIGLSKKEISTARDVAYITTEKILETVKRKFDYHSLNILISTIQIRLVLFALCGCTVKK